MAEKEEKSPITPTLRVMKIGEEFTYPIQMMTSVRTCMYHIRTAMGKDIQNPYRQRG